MKTLGFMAAIIIAGAMMITLWGAILVALTRPGAGAEARASEVPFFFSAGAFATFVVLGGLVVVLRRIDRT
jgi:type III secretory pathway component EscT